MSYLSIPNDKLIAHCVISDTIKILKNAANIARIDIESLINAEPIIVLIVNKLHICIDSIRCTSIPISIFSNITIMQDNITNNTSMWRFSNILASKLLLLQFKLLILGDDSLDVLQIPVPSTQNCT